MEIDSNYPDWIRNDPSVCRIIKSARDMSAYLDTNEGRTRYQKYLDEQQERVRVAKSQPTAGDVHVNQPLTMVSIAYLPTQGFIADIVFPNIPVAKQSDRYIVYPRDQWFRSDAKPRGPGTESAGTGYEIDNTPTYSCVPFAVHHDVPDPVRANADSMIDPDRDATELVTRQLGISRERQWASRFFTTGVWTGSTTAGDITPTTLWSAANSTPIDDIEAQNYSIETKTGYRPNTIVFGADTWKTIRNHPTIIDRFKYTQQGIITEALVAGVLDVERVVVARAVHNVATERGALDMERVMNSKSAMLCYANPRPSLMAPSAGYIFSWTGYVGAGPAGQRVRRFRMEPLDSDRVEGEMAYDMKLIGSDLGVYFNGAVA
jgi:hypothetical protein